jgi:hypothetical protein
VFDHVKFGVSNFAMSKAFFLKALEPLGVTVVTDWPPDGVAQPTERCGFIVSVSNRGDARASSFGVHSRES